MERILIYQTSFLEESTDTVCTYIGSHRTSDDLWPSKGCSDTYIGSSGIAMNKVNGYVRGTKENVKKGWKWLHTEILQECDGSTSTLAIEGEWIFSAMLLFGIHAEAKRIIARRDKDHPLLQIRTGTCLNCHKNTNKFQNTEYYTKWLSSQGERSKLGNTPAARAKAVQTRLSHKSQWICLERIDLSSMPLRTLSIVLGLGRGAQQCWSRLGKPDYFIFKCFTFKLVRCEISSHIE